MFDGGVYSSFNGVPSNMAATGFLLASATDTYWIAALLTDRVRVNVFDLSRIFNIVNKTSNSRDRFSNSSLIFFNERQFPFSSS